jgi:hypothetical protein
LVLVAQLVAATILAHLETVLSLMLFLQVVVAEAALTKTVLH